MYIRQATLFSFEQIMEFQQETKLELILSQIDVSKLSSVLKKPSYSKGANGYGPSSLIYALLAMQILKIKTIKDLVSMLKEYLNLNSIRSKGILKAKIHALLNCIVLVAGNLVTNKKKH